jgi:hypothetical protein
MVPPDPARPRRSEMSERTAIVVGVGAETHEPDLRPFKEPF